MSIAYCDRCGDLIDTDEDPEAMQPPGQRYAVLDERCRERVAIQAESNNTGETKR